VVEAIRTNREPVFEQEDEAVVSAFTRAAYLDRRVSDALYARAVEILGRMPSSISSVSSATMR